jgi:hypothetical protein
MEFQLSLLKIEQSKFKAVVVKLHTLPHNDALESLPLTSDFLADIDMRGILEAPVVAKTERGLFVISGARRIKAARELGHETIKIMRGEMPLWEAQMARSAANNQRQDNSIADLTAVNLVLSKKPGASVKEISQMTGIKQGRVKTLLPMAKLPRILIEGIGKGHISAETVRILSVQTTVQREEALRRYRENLSHWSEVEGGWKNAAAKDPEKIYLKTPVLLTREDIVEFQAARVASSVAQLPDPVPFDVANFVPQDTAPQPVVPAPTQIALPIVPLTQEAVVLGYAILDDKEHFMSDLLHERPAEPESFLGWKIVKIVL